MKPKPNILVIFSDQLRRQALGVYGDPNVATPHIDALANGGARFRSACSTYPVCVPFRFTLMTGEYAHSRFVPSSDWRMSPAERTLADEFNDAGYETFYVGKWHLQGSHGVLKPIHHSYRKGNRTPVPRLHQGRFQHWRGFEISNDPYDTCYFVDGDPAPHRIDKYQTDGLCDLGIELMASRLNRAKPFFGIISVEPPHPARVAPPELTAKWAQRELRLPPNFAARDEKQRQRFMEDLRSYYAMIENLDQNVGRLRAYLQQAGLAKNTIVVLLADHGDLAGSHGLERKHWPYEESIGIPLIAAGPGCCRQVIEDPTCTEDLFPTLLGLAGLKAQNELPGMDLSPVIGGAAQSLPREGVYLEWVAHLSPRSPFHAQPWRGFRGQRFKYVVHGGAEGGIPWQFFDLQADPFEMNNLVHDAAYGGEVARYHGLLRAQIAATGDHYVLAPAFGFDGVNLWQ